MEVTFPFNLKLESRYCELDKEWFDLCFLMEPSFWLLRNIVQRGLTIGRMEESSEKAGSCGVS